MRGVPRWPHNGGGIAGGRAIETVAFGAAVMVVLRRLFNWIHGSSRKMSEIEVMAAGQKGREIKLPLASSITLLMYISKHFDC
jgi:hypothetical protein